MRTESTLYISAESLIYELRVARALMRDHNITLDACKCTFHVERLLDNMIEVIEDVSRATKVPLPPGFGLPTEAGLGSEQLGYEPDGWNPPSSSTAREN